MKTWMECIFAPKKGYAHSKFIPTPEGECFICKEPYSGGTGCHPIRLTECGHTMGLECFRECTARTPEKCPYGGHDLCATYQSHEERSLVSILAWLWSTRLLRCTDPFNHLIFFRKFLLGGIEIRHGLGIWDVLHLNVAYTMTALDSCYLPVLVVSIIITGAKWWGGDKQEPYQTMMNAHKVCMARFAAMVVPPVLVLVNAALAYAWWMNPKRPAKFRV